MCDCERVECPCCKGRGERVFECEACAGTGEVRRDLAEADEACNSLWEGNWYGTAGRRPASPERCRACGGRGHRTETCRTCGGTGLLDREDAEEICQQQRAAEQQAAERARRRAAAEADLRARALRAWRQEVQRLQASPVRRSTGGWRGWLFGLFAPHSTGMSPPKPER